MKESCRVLELVEGISSRNVKIHFLKENQSKELAFLLETALNPLLNYGVIDFDDEKVHRDTIPTLAELQALRNELVHRRVAGGQAKELMQKTLLCSDDIVRKWLVRVFKKNLQAGTSVATANKIWPGLIPVFEIGLCNNFEGEIEEKLPDGEWILEPKYDGLRAIAIVDADGDVTFLSRGSKPLYNVQHIGEQLKKSGVRDVVFDGEMWAKNWNDSISILHSRGEHKKAESLVYYVFDVLTMEEWRSRKTRGLLRRKDGLYSIFEAEGPKLENVKAVLGRPVEDFHTAKHYFEQYIEEGYEGAVLKRTNTEYPFGRSDDWLKWKKTFDVDAQIVGYQEGTGRNKGRLGALICDFKGTKVRVGGGYSDAQRTEYWKDRDQMVGLIAEVKAWEVTVHNSLRHPVFVRIREDAVVKCDCGNDTTEVEYSDGLKARHCSKCDIDFVVDPNGSRRVIS